MSFPQKAMLLAAGLGERLRPLTFTIPKPLLSIGGRALIEYNLTLLSKFGVKEVMINLHHLGNKIQEYLGKKYLNLKIEYSEEREILGTGGGLKAVESYFKNNSFFMMNADTLIDLNLHDLYSFHEKQQGIATLVVVKSNRPDVERAIFVGNNSEIIQISKEPPTAHPFQKTIFTGIQLIEPSLLRQLPKNKKTSIVDEAYLPLLEKKKPIFAYLHEGYWEDVGSFERIEKTEKKFETGWPYTTLKPEDFPSK